MTPKVALLQDFGRYEVPATRCWSERINNHFICVGVDFSIYALLTGERSLYSPV